MMNLVADLVTREHRLRERVRRAPAGEVGASAAERRWIRKELHAMGRIIDRHLAQFEPSRRELEAYRLEFELPMYQYLSRAFTFLFPETVEDLR